MYKQLTKLFYAAAIFLLLSVMFVLQPAEQKEVVAIQTDIKQEMSRGFIQLWGDEPVLTSLEIVWDGINKFYGDAADVTIAMMHPVVDLSLPDYVDYLASDVDQKLMAILWDEKEVLDTRMAWETQKEPIYNIIPPFDELSIIESEINLAFSELESLGEGIVAGETVSNLPDNPWLTMTDVMTGEEYCVAIYNGEVNKYQGECKYDYY